MVGFYHWQIPTLFITDKFPPWWGFVMVGMCWVTTIIIIIAIITITIIIIIIIAIIIIAIIIIIITIIAIISMIIIWVAPKSNKSREVLYLCLCGAFMQMCVNSVCGEEGWFSF